MQKRGRTCAVSCYMKKLGWIVFLAYLPAQAKILDLGCGSGRPIAAYLLQHGHQLTGVDSVRQHAGDGT